MKFAPLFLFFFSSSLWADILVIENNCSRGLKNAAILNSDVWSETIHINIPPNKTIRSDTGKHSKNGDKLTLDLYGLSGSDLSCTLTADGETHYFTLKNSNSWYYPCMIENCK